MPLRDQNKWRLFVAISLPAALTQTLQSIQMEITDELKESGSKLRWTHPEDLHLTLFFLGAVAPEKISDLSLGIKEVAAAHISFTADALGLGAFPDEKRPRVLWAGLKGNSELRSLQKALTERVALLGFKDEKEKFVPHVTLARVKDGTALESFIEKYRRHRLGAFEAADLVLYRSRPNPSGPRYQALERFSLAKCLEEKSRWI